MNFYKNGINDFNYDNVIDYMKRVSDGSKINGETNVDVNGVPFFSRCDFPIPSQIPIPATDVYKTAQGQAPILVSDGMIYFPFSYLGTSFVGAGVLKLNSNNLNESILLSHSSNPTNHLSLDGAVGGDYYCLIPDGRIISTTAGRSGDITKIAYIDSRKADALKFDWNVIPSTSTGLLISTWGNPIYNKKHNCVYFAPSGNNFDATDSWVRLNVNTDPFTLETYSFNYNATDFYSDKYKFAVQTKNNRIFLLPHSVTSGSITTTKFHYIDCSGDNPTVVAYDIGGMIPQLYGSGTPYQGGVYIPELDRIYLIPHYQMRDTTNKRLHYISNCSTSPSIVMYNHTSSDPFTTTGAYTNGLYIGNGLIFLIPTGQCTQAKLHLLDVYNNNLISYNTFLRPLNPSPVNEKVDTWIAGATLVDDKIFFSFRAGTRINNQVSWFYLRLNHNVPFNREFTSHSLKLNS
jgi:hypothetical protein